MFYSVCLVRVISGSCHRSRRPKLFPERPASSSLANGNEILLSVDTLPFGGGFETGDVPIFVKNWRMCFTSVDYIQMVKGSTLHGLLLFSNQPQARSNTDFLPDITSLK